MTYVPQTLDDKITMVKSANCDEYDYLLAVACGSIAGLVDVFLVGTPKSSFIGSWSDEQVDHVVELFARYDGWSGTGIASAICYLEKRTVVNYDQSTTAAVNGKFSLAAKNHHLKSLAHAPDSIGLFFSILDQFQGKASFVSDGKLIRIDANTCELHGETLHAKIYCGFCNWLGHVISDAAGSSSSRSGTGRGSGVVIPFYELLQFVDVEVQTQNGRESFSKVMEYVFIKGYDARFGIAMEIPVLMTDLFIRVIWAIKRHFYHKYAWEDCIPSDKYSDLRLMLIIGNCTLCLFDGADALIRAKNIVEFFLRLNIIAWFKLVLLIFKEILIRYSFTYADLKLQFVQINDALNAHLSKLQTIDYAKYELELREIQMINNLLSDENAGTGQIYAYLIAVNEKMQFSSFEEFDQQMQEKDFILEI